MANPIDVKNTPNILPLPVGIAKSYMAAVMIGGKRATAIPCKIRTAKSPPQSARKPRSRNDNVWIAKAKRIIRFFPIRLATVPMGSLRNIEKREGMAIKRPKSKKEKPRASMCNGKTGVKASQPVHRKKLVPNIAYNFRSFSSIRQLLVLCPELENCLDISYQKE